MSYVPRQIFNGDKDAEKKYRRNNGASNYEYQHLGDVSFEGCIDALGIKKYDHIEMSHKFLRIVSSILKEAGPYKLLTNNCQHFVIHVAELFNLEDQIIFMRCT